MKQQILILGAGFAGMWAALSAARLADLHGRHDIEITVLAPQPELRIRPRFYESEVENYAAPLLPLFAVTGVKFLAGVASEIDSTSQQVWYHNEQDQLTAVRYDRLIMATGSHIAHALPGAQLYAFNVDKMESAARLERHLAALAEQPESAARNTVIVCGGGFTGIEVATEMPARLRAILGDSAAIRVIVVDRSPVAGGRYSEQLRDVISQASVELGVEWRLNSEIKAIDESGLTLKNGEHIASSTVILTVGVQASPLTRQIPGERDPQGRLHVDQQLRVIGQNAVYATGDVAFARTDDQGNHALMTCQHAIMLGRFVGHNVAADLIGIEPLPYRQVNYVTCLDLGAWGAVYSEGWDQVVKFTKEEGKKIKVSITNELIYPPQAEREVAFAAADPLAPFV
ncbi:MULTISPECIES: NAD(P)/FAD-dependent oxidoreductase [Serratia]|uniref:NAD(P)/FAD-dependent oxidoreductase n=1 Tax=Serratia TaxID=613 RepID=UPI0019DDF768|nr:MULTISPECIES: FAD-dependent oxidoreductase [Serratia]MBE0151032.1 NAD(P)/FAD-dependent oxidoreductase [Serratia fonticola]MDQ7209810.1 FAD-dependent oxidoreductase [Serratia fonticola]HBE9079180.1 FAD-dependent oxidoreductase [Serratia fonticola]HBE9090550.1 FAD-dependent oxidoreductase [Serratia fonticola]HBE9153313.1 FAD-dependent oxidoreductase [Serratia fonticola]